MYTISTSKTKNIETAKSILIALGVDASFSGYSDANGVSVYFVDSNGRKIRVSNHSVTSHHRLENEVHFYFDQQMMGLGGKISIKSNMKINELEASRL